MSAADPPSTQSHPNPRFPSQREGNRNASTVPPAAPPHGRLRIFLGYAPGTGKTRAMLQEACRLAEQGQDVVVGFLDAAGMPFMEHLQTCAALLDPGTTMSIDTILTRRPQWVVMDDLAHGNPPAARHQLRSLDVEELLAAGINVLTTLNIYQIESQADAVANLFSLPLFNTVPDGLVQPPAEIVMVDCAPDVLLAQYDSAEINFPPHLSAMAQKIYQRANLFTLRELTMRFVVRHSSDALEDAAIRRAGMLSQRILVCIAPDETGVRLIHTAQSMADETRAEWVVVYVETPDHLDLRDDEQTWVARHFRLAEMLGARTETLTGRSVAEAVRDFAHRNHIQKIVMGRSANRAWYDVFSRSQAETLLRLEPGLDLYIVGEDRLPRRVRPIPFWYSFTFTRLLGSVVLAAIPTMLGLLLSPWVISRSANLIMLYLLAVVVASIFLGLGPALLAALLSILAFKFWFVPPLYRLTDFAPEYAITFVALFVVSAILSSLVSRERTLTRAANRRAEQISQLYELSRDLTGAVDMSQILQTIVTRVRETFDREALVLLADQGKLTVSASSSGQEFPSTESAAADWAFAHNRPAGSGTGTFSYAAFRFFPLIASRGSLGVLGVRFTDHEEMMHPEQTRLLGAFISKAAMAIERGIFANEASQTEVLRATEKLQTALLSSISHDLRTPLASITGVLSSLRMEDEMLDAETRRDLVETALDESERLNRLVGNLLDMSRLEAGTLRIAYQPCDVEDLIGSALNTLATRLEEHPIKIDLQPDLPLVPIDYVLVAQVMLNLLDNAAKYSPEGGAIEVAARIVGGEPDGDVEMSVSDHGPGIPPEDLERIFEKFYRVKRFEHVVGTGLGLSICKGIVEVHGGRIFAENRPQGGVRVFFTLPLHPTAVDANVLSKTSV